MAGTLKAAIDRINGLATPPEFISTPGTSRQIPSREEFDTLDQMLKGAKRKDVFYVPGEHDMLTTTGKAYLERYGKGRRAADGTASIIKGVHFIGLVNVDEPQGGRTGNARRGATRVAEKRCEAAEAASHAHRGVRAHSACGRFIRSGVGGRRIARRRSISQAIRIGHGTQRPHPPGDAEGGRQRHISHRDVDRISAAAPGKAHSPGPMKVPAEQLKSVLGITDVDYVRDTHSLAVVDSTLA